MTELLEDAVKAAKTLPPETQDELARMILQVAGRSQAILILSPEEEASFKESLLEADRGDFAGDEEIRSIWAKYDL